MPAFDLSASVTRISTNLTKWYNQCLRADTHFWNGAVREYLVNGSVSSDPLNAAKEIVSACSYLVNEALQEMGLITGHAFTAIDWTVTPYSDKHSSYHASVNAVKSYIVDISNDAKGIYTDSAEILNAQTAIASALEHMYHQVEAWLKLFGANFPAVFTPYYPTAAMVCLKCEGKAGTLELTGLESDKATEEDWDAGATWDEIAVGDTIYIESLDSTEFPTFADYEGCSYVVAAVNSVAGVLELTVPGGGVVAAVTSSRIATGPQDLFSLRKVHAA